MLKHNQSITGISFKPLLVGLVFAIALTGCAGQTIVIPWQGKTIEIVPRQQIAAVEAEVFSSTLTPFQPIADEDGQFGLTAVAQQQLMTQTATLETSTDLASETPVVVTASASLIAALSETALTETLTQTPAQSQTITITPSLLKTQTNTLVLSSATMARTLTSSRTPSKTQVPVGFTQTFTRTPVPATQIKTTAPISNTSTNTVIAVDPVNTSAFTAVANTSTSVPVVPAGCVYTENTGYESTLINLINDKRSAEKLTPYGVNGLLTNAARGHSQDMACNDYFNHTGLDGSTSPSRVAAAGYSYSWVGENIYAGSSGNNSPQTAFTWWVNSEPHLANLMNTNYTEIGIGYIYCANSTYGGYFTANFARP